MWPERRLAFFSFPFLEPRELGAQRLAFFRFPFLEPRELGAQRLKGTFRVGVFKGKPFSEGAWCDSGHHRDLSYPAPRRPFFFSVSDFTKATCVGVGQWRTSQRDTHNLCTFPMMQTPSPTLSYFSVVRGCDASGCRRSVSNPRLFLSVLGGFGRFSTDLFVQIFTAQGVFLVDLVLPKFRL